MAQESFTPAVNPINPESFMNYSRPVSQPKTDISGLTRGQAFKELGEGLGGALSKGAHLADTVEKNYIDESLKQELDPINQEQIKRLSAIDDVLTRSPETILGPQAGNKELPEQLKQLPQMADNLIAIRDSGKLSPIQFDILRNERMQYWRSAFPGQRDHIDSYGERISHQRSANKVINDLTADVNASIAAYKSQKDKADTKFLETSTKYPELVQDYLDYHNGKKGLDETLRRFSEVEGQKTKWEMDDLRLRNATAQKTWDTDTAKRSVGNNLLGDAGLSLSRVQAPGPDGAVKDLSRILSENYGNLPAEASIKIRQHLDGVRAEWELRMLREGTQAGPNNTPSRAEGVGGIAEYTKLVKEAADNVFNPVAKLFAADMIPQAVAAQHINEGQKNEAQQALVKQYPWMRNLAAGLEILGKSDAAAQWFINATTDQTITESLKGMNVALPTAIATQPDWPKTTFTFGQAFEATREVPGADGAKLRNATVDNATKVITTPGIEPRAKVNAIRGLADPANKGFMDMIAPDGFTTDPKDGRIRITPGKNTTLAKITGDDVMKSVAKHADPQLKQQYIETTQHFFGNVFSTITSTLNKFATDPDIKFSWDNENHKVEVTGTIPPFTESLRRTVEGKDPIHAFLDLTNFKSNLTQMPEIKFQTQQMNEAIGALTRLRDHLAPDVDINAFLLQTFVLSGIVPSDNSIPGQMMKAFMNANKPQPTKADAGPTGKGASKETYGMTPEELSEREEETK